MLSSKSFAFVLGALIAVSAICAEAHFNLHGRNGIDVGVGSPLGGAHIGLGFPGIDIGHHGGHSGRQGQQPTKAPSTTAAPAKCNCQAIPINRRCGPNCDQLAFQGNVRNFKSAGCCAATPCQMRGNKADYEDFKSYVCSRNFNC